MKSTRGFTLIELLIVMAIVAILLSISTAIYRQMVARGGEAAAIAALDAINQAQFGYMQTCGNQRYAPTLAELGRPMPTSGVAFLSPDLAVEGEEVIKSGYVLRMTGTPVDEEVKTCTGATPASGYQLTADPTVPGGTGSRYFGTNTDRVIFEDVETFYGSMPERGTPQHGRELDPKS